MIYKMSPNEYFKKIIELYDRSRYPKFYNPNIKRGRSSSISSDLEDLTALFIALNNPNICSYFTDQPIRFGGATTKYPDIIIQNENKKIDNLIDVKTDLGWSRNETLSFCEKWEAIIEAVKGTKTSFKLGHNKEVCDGEFSTKLKYHVVVISKKNSGKIIDEHYKEVKEKLKNVNLYIMSDVVHPNSYKYSPSELLDKIKVNEDEFDRLFKYII